MRYAKYKLIVNEEENLASGPSPLDISMTTFAVDDDGWHFCWTSSNKDFSEFNEYNMSEVTQEDAFYVYSQHITNPAVLDDGSFGRFAEEDFIKPLNESSDPLA